MTTTTRGPRCARLASALVAAVACAMPIAGRADTVASLLGNFTINQYAELAFDDTTAHVHFAVVFGQLPALRELHLADVDNDGVTTQKERDDHVAKLAPEFAGRLELLVDGVAIPLKATTWTSSLPTEQGGFSMRLDVDYDGVLPAATPGRQRTLRFDNRNYAGRFGWHEMVVKPAPGIAAFDTDAFSTSLTDGLKEALSQLPANGPLDERAAALAFRDGTAPAGARLLGARPTDGAVAVASTPSTSTSGAAATAGSGDWLQYQTKQLVDLISAPHVPVHVALLALLAAMALGAVHAFSPGHGKTIVGAYLIGSRSTPRHAVFLGVTVTVTHTLVVFAIGLATLVASRWFLPERLFPALSLLSGLLVLGMGVVLLMQRWRGARSAVAEAIVRRVEKTLPPMPYRRVAPESAQRPFGLSAGRRTTSLARHHPHGGGHPHAHDHGHDHGHDHDHAHDHADGLMHSHGGGTMHSHLPPSQVTWRSLLALGMSGGLVPCPSALVLLLAAIALNKTFYGLLLVVAFSVGLALTLVAVGMAFLYAKSRFRKPLSTSVWPKVLPALSAALIAVVGLVLCYGALLSVTAKAV